MTQYQMPRIICVCHHWDIPSHVSPEEIKQWINLEELSEMTRVVGEKSTARNYNMEFIVDIAKFTKDTTREHIKKVGSILDEANGIWVFRSY